MKITDDIVKRQVWLEPTEELLRMIPQNTKRCTVVTDEPKHTSIWDYAISPGGRHYFSVCAEGTVSEYLRLYEYFPNTGEYRLCFRLEDVTVTHDRAIRPSKVHSSLCFLPDERVLMSTHTTAAAPGHPRWMPFAYYDHLWEGFPGSQVLLYDPATGKVEDFGIPVPRESFYGGTYDPGTHSFYASGYHRGHIYRFDLTTRNVTDFGQATEFGTWRYVPGLDGNLYTSTATGRLVRINLKEQRIEDIPYDFPMTARLLSDVGTNNKLMHYAHVGGALYLTSLSNPYLMRYDYTSGELKIAGELLPESWRKYPWAWKTRCMGMAEEDGVLWYLLNLIGYGEFLMRRDIRHNCSPENMGLMGSRTRVMQASFGCFIRDGVLYATDTNRLAEPVAVHRVELRDIVKHRGEGPLTEDYLLYMKLQDGEERYRAVTGRELREDGYAQYEASEKGREARLNNAAFIATLPKDADYKAKVYFNGDSAFNSTSLPCVRKWAAKLWQQGISGPVQEVRFNAVGNVVAVCGEGPYLRVTIRDGVILSREDDAAYIPKNPEATARKYAAYELPHQPERRWLAFANAACELPDGRTVIGTQDGMLCIVKDGRVFSLGAVCREGAVHDLAVSSDGVVYGVAGDREALGTLFSYDDAHGVTLYGRVFFQDPASPGILASSSEPYCITVSPDGSSVAVGVRDRLTCVYRFDLRWK